MSWRLFHSVCCFFVVSDNGSIWFRCFAGVTFLAMAVSLVKDAARYLGRRRARAGSRGGSEV